MKTTKVIWVVMLVLSTVGTVWSGCRVHQEQVRREHIQDSLHHVHDSAMMLVMKTLPTEFKHRDMSLIDEACDSFNYAIEHATPEYITDIDGKKWPTYAKDSAVNVWYDSLTVLTVKELHEVGPWYLAHEYYTDEKFKQVLDDGWDGLCGWFDPRDIYLDAAIDKFYEILNCSDVIEQIEKKKHETN